MNDKDSSLQGFFILISLGLFGGSVYFYIQGNSELAFYLLGCATFIILFMSFIYIASIDTIQDDFERKALSQLKENHEEIKELLGPIEEYTFWNKDK